MITFRIGAYHGSLKPRTHMHNVVNEKNPDITPGNTSTPGPMPSKTEQVHSASKPVTARQESQVPYSGAMFVHESTIQCFLCDAPVSTRLLPCGHTVRNLCTEHAQRARKCQECKK